MTCGPEYSDALATLKSMLKKSDLLEVKRGDKGQRKNVRFVDYFPEKYTGAPKKLKRYLQRLLQYSAQSTTDDETRADVVADGPGLNEQCIVQLEQATRVPLPGLSNDYGEDSISQKKRLLDLLLTFVILFHQEEQTLALQDLRLKGPMLTGLATLFHQINTSSTALPAKLMEEYLGRAIARAENGDGLMLLKSFQGNLRLQKQMEPTYNRDEARYRRLLFTCCATLATEDTNVPLPSTIPQVLKGGGRRQEQTYYAKQDWDVYEDLIEEYTALAVAAPVAAPSYQYQPTGMSSGQGQQQYPRKNDNGQQSYPNRFQPRNGDRRQQPNEKYQENRTTREEYFTKKFCTNPCASCGNSSHPMLSPIKTPEGAPLDCDYICPAAMCTNWQEQRKQKNALRFQPCPKKFAAMCHNNASTAHTASQDYEQIGSGQYRNPQDRSSFRREVLSYCDPPKGPADYPRGTASHDRARHPHLG